jgi:hypothetical protein
MTFKSSFYWDIGLFLLMLLFGVLFVAFMFQIDGIDFYKYYNVTSISGGNYRCSYCDSSNVLKCYSCGADNMTIQASEYFGVK